MARLFPGISNGSTAPEAGVNDDPVMDLQRRRDELNGRVAELQWDLGGLVYEMAVRDRFRMDIVVERAAALQVVEAELSEIERIVALEKTRVAGICQHCDAPHSSGASFCWQCGSRIMDEVDSSSIFTSTAAE